MDWYSHTGAYRYKSTDLDFSDILVQMIVTTVYKYFFWLPILDF